MYLEFCGGGALDDVMKVLEKPLTEPQIRFTAHEVIKGLEFLHKHLIIHRDLKAGNILITQRNEIRLGKTFFEIDAFCMFYENALFLIFLRVRFHSRIFFVSLS